MLELRKTLTESDISHLSINDVGTYIHAQIDDHIDNGLIHFTKGSIDHTGIFNIGTNAHTQIDAHIAGTGAAVHGDTHLQNTGDTSTGDYTFDGKVGIGIVPTENFHVYKANDIAFKTEVDKTTNTFFSGIRMEFVDSKDGGTTGFNNFQAITTHSAAGSWYTQNQTNFDTSFLLTGKATQMLTARNFLSQIYIRQADGAYKIGTLAAGQFSVSTALDTGGYTHTITNMSALVASAGGGWDNSNATWNVTNMVGVDITTDVGRAGATVNVTDVIGIYVRDPFSNGAGTGTKTNVSGIKIDIPTGGTNKFGLWLNGDGLGADVVMGANKGKKIYSDGTDLILDPNVVGSGKVLIGATGDDTINAGAYEVAGVAGVNFSGAVTNITVVNGIVTAAS